MEVTNDFSDWGSGSGGSGSGSSGSSINNSDDAMLDPPNGYKTMCIFNLIFSVVACVLCTIVLLAVTVPLLFPNRRKRYSTYNLYLAFMAITELFQNVLSIYLLLSHKQWNPRPFIFDDDEHDHELTWMFKDEHEHETEDQHLETAHNDDHHDHEFDFDDHGDDDHHHHEFDDDHHHHELIWMFDFPYDYVTIVACLTCNLYINAFLMFELYKLLKSSNKRRKHRPPSIATVTKHGIISYGLGIFMGTLHHHVINIAVENDLWGILLFAFESLFCVVIPLSIMLWVSYQILRNALLVSTESMHEGRLKFLVMYFARIVLCDLLILIPSIAFFVVFIGSRYSPFKILAFNLSLLFSAANAIVTFVCAMTKPDVLDLVTDLVYRWVYCRQGGGDLDSSFSNDPYLSRFSLTASQLATQVRLAAEGPDFSSDIESDDDDDDDNNNNNNGAALASDQQPETNNDGSSSTADCTIEDAIDPYLDGTSHHQRSLGSSELKKTRRSQGSTDFRPDTIPEHTTKTV